MIEEDDRGDFTELESELKRLRPKSVSTRLMIELAGRLEPAGARREGDAQGHVPHRLMARWRALLRQGRGDAHRTSTPARLHFSETLSHEPGPDGKAVSEPPAKTSERGKSGPRNEILSEFRYGSGVEERGTRFSAAATPISQGLQPCHRKLGGCETASGAGPSIGSLSLPAFVVRSLLPLAVLLVFGVVAVRLPKVNSSPQAVPASGSGTEQTGDSRQTAPVLYKPVSAEKLVYGDREETFVTLADGTPARQVRDRYLDTITWRNPRTKASLTWSIPRDEIRVIPISAY